MAYGRYDTKTAILPHKTINEKVANQYLQVPFSGGGLSNGVYNDTDGPESCNMHATVILDPEAERPIQTISADCVLSSPRKIITDSTTFPYASQPLVGLEPPNITITINGTKSTDLDISFN